MRRHLHITSEKYIPYFVGVLASLGIFSAILLGLGFDPILSLATLFYGSLGSVFSASETLVRATPLLLSALAFLVGFKARFFNIGVEGQLYVGALTAYLAASHLGGVPGVVVVPLVAVAGFIGGTAWLALPLFMRLKLKINELFPTLVMNSVAVFLINGLTSGPLRDPNAVNPQTPQIPQSIWLPVLIPGTRLSLGVVLAVLLALLTFIVLYKTVLGYEVRAAGLSPRAAQLGGVSLSRSIASVGLLSGGLAGLAGMIEVTGTSHLLAQGFSPGYGYQGIGIAALGAFHPIGVLFASFFYSVLQIGGESLQRGAGVPIEITYVLQATIVISVLIIERWYSGRKW